MGINFDITFYDADGKEIGGITLERAFTHYPDDVRKFWNELCYTEKPKKEFVNEYLTKIQSYDPSSDEFMKLASAFGKIVSSEGWCEAIMISIGSH